VNLSLWATCTEGHAHWGPRGAAGLLIAREGAVLLQLRARWTHRGGTWSLPGGALEHGEEPVDAALREAVEELGMRRDAVTVRGSRVATCGGWAYETVLAEPVVGADIVVRESPESAGHEWVGLDEVADRRLHPAFRTAWEDDDAVLRDFVSLTGR
jgi:8-oxo-dGTP diphosphatase